MKIKKILFVCSGNSCRSVMAEYLMKKACERKNISLEVRSRGIHPEKSVNPYTVHVLKGTRAASHIPRKLEQADIDHADLVLTMNQWMQANIILFYPNLHENFKKVYILKEILGHKNKDIADPYDSQFIIKNGKRHTNHNKRRIFKTYATCCNNIQTYITQLLKKRNNLRLPTNSLKEIFEYYIQEKKERFKKGKNK